MITWELNSAVNPTAAKTVSTTRQANRPYPFSLQNLPIKSKKQSLPQKPDLFSTCKKYITEQNKFTPLSHQTTKPPNHQTTDHKLIGNHPVLAPSQNNSYFFIFLSPILLMYSSNSPASNATSKSSSWGPWTPAVWISSWITATTWPPPLSAMTWAAPTSLSTRKACTPVAPSSTRSARTVCRRCASVPAWAHQRTSFQLLC